MGKNKPRKSAKPSPKAESSNKQIDTTTTSGLKADPKLWYKIRVLVHDLRNLAKDRAAESRLLSTADELYISSPYFSADEAAAVKSALVDHAPEEILPDAVLPDAVPEGVSADAVPPPGPETVERAIQRRLANFFEKRRASGDSRPCGPHDMAPVYQVVFGIGKEALSDPAFTGRLHRSGLAS